MVGVRGRLLVAALGLAVGSVAGYRHESASLWLPDLIVGLTAALLALLTWRTSKLASTLALLVAVTWWAGTLWPLALYWHRGPLVQLVLSVGGHRRTSRVVIVMVVIGYVAAVVPAVWQSPAAALGIAVGVVAAAILEAVSQRRPDPIVLSLGLASALAVGMLTPYVLGEATGALVALISYDLMIVLLLLTSAVLLRHPSRAALTDLAVELGPAPARDLETLTAMVRAQPGLDLEADVRSALAEAHRLEIANERVRAEVRDALLEVSQSRRRLVLAGAAERERLAHELSSTASGRLREIMTHPELPPSVSESLGRASASLDAAVLGLRPPALSDGLLQALRQHPLIRSLDATVEGSAGRYDGVVEDTLYAVAAEALANAAKHAGPGEVRVTVHPIDTRVLILEVSDEGRGGAAVSGSGLAGLADRMAAIGGTLEVWSGPRGTTIRASAPQSVTATGPHPPTWAGTPAEP